MDQSGIRSTRIKQSHTGVAHRRYAQL